MQAHRDLPPPGVGLLVLSGVRIQGERCGAARIRELKLDAARYENDDDLEPWYSSEVSELLDEHADELLALVDWASSFPEEAKAAVRVYLDNAEEEPTQ